MTRVRVVHVSSVHRANDPRIFEKECASLSAEGYRVTLIATGEPPPADFEVIGLPRPARRLVRMTWGTTRAVYTALRLHPRIVHLHDPELLPWLVLFRLFGIAVVFDSHEDIPASMSYKTYLGRWAAPWTLLSRTLVRFVDRTANGVVAATPTIARAFSNPRTVVVQNFPILDGWAPSTSPPLSQPRLVYVGSLSEERGAMQMLDIVDALGRSHGATLKVAGWASDQLLERMRAHSGWQYVQFLGSISRDEVQELLATSSIGLVVFQPSPNHVASQPTKMFEYMAAGLPVLASDFPLWRTLILTESAGLVADPTDVPALIAAATRMADDQEAAAEMGRRGRALAEQQHNWHSEALTLSRFYEQILSG